MLSYIGCACLGYVGTMIIIEIFKKKPTQNNENWHDEYLKNIIKNPDYSDPFFDDCK